MLFFIAEVIKWVFVCVFQGKWYFLAAKTYSFSPITEVYKVEALGPLLAMEQVRELDFKDVIFELDAMVVDDFNKCSSFYSDYDCILNHCKETFTYFSNNSPVKLSRMKANKVAHTLADVALFSASSHTLLDAPICIFATIKNEMEWIPFAKKNI